MSEYPIHCANCGDFLGYVHATVWSDNYFCEKCPHERLEGGKK